MNPIYSPRPIQDFFCMELPDDEFRVIARARHFVAIWNLYWLSVPEIDCVPVVQRHQRAFHYVPCPTKYKAVILDAMDDEQLQSHLHRPPAEFLHWFQAERDYTIYECWDAFGPRWPEVVRFRAEQAILHRLKLQPFVTVRGGKVVVDLEKML